MKNKIEITGYVTNILIISDALGVIKLTFPQKNDDDTFTDVTVYCKIDALRVIVENNKVYNLKGYIQVPWDSEVQYKHPELYIIDSVEIESDYVPQNSN